MVKYEAIWLDKAIPSFAALPVDARDQIEALVNAICGNPGIGLPNLANPDLLLRARVAVAGPAVVFYELLDDAEIVRIMRVLWRG